MLPSGILNIILQHLYFMEAINLLSTSKELYNQINKINVKNMRLFIEINRYGTIFTFNGIPIYIRKHNYHNSMNDIIQYFFVKLRVSLFTIEEKWNNTLYTEIFKLLKNIDLRSILIINMPYLYVKNPFHHVVKTIHNKEYCPNVILCFDSYRNHISYSSFVNRENISFKFLYDKPPYDIPSNLQGLNLQF